MPLEEKSRMLSTNGNDSSKIKKGLFKMRSLPREDGHSQWELFQEKMGIPNDGSSKRKWVDIQTTLFPRKDRPSSGHRAKWRALHLVDKEKSSHGQLWEFNPKDNQLTQSMPPTSPARAATGTRGHSRRRYFADFKVKQGTLKYIFFISLAGVAATTVHAGDLTPTPHTNKL